MSRVLAVFEKWAIRGELVLVNDGSLDRTGAIIKTLAEQNPGVVVGCHHDQNRGLAAGWKTGVGAARGEFGCIIDSDLQYQPEDIPLLFSTRRAGKEEIVQGYRNTIGKLFTIRYAMSRTLSYVLNGVFGMSLRDNKSGFFVGRLEALRDILTHRYQYDYFQILVMVAAASKGYSIKELEVVFMPRTAGKSFIPRFPWMIVWGCLKDVSKGILEYRIGRTDRPQHSRHQ